MHSEDEKTPESNDLEETKKEPNFPGDKTVNDDTHRVTVTVTVAVAYQKPNDEHSKLMDELIRRNKKTVEAPRPHQYLHCEYVVAPKYEKVLTDVVTYSVAAKVFTENDARVVKTWDDGKLIWVAWMHSHKLEVTSKNVLQLYNHTIDMKIWDAKEKVSIKARTDRPKAFRLPSANETNFPGKGVQAAVLKQSNSWLNLQPRDSVTDISKKSEKRSSIPPLNQMDIAGQEITKEKKEEPVPVSPMRVRSSLGRLAGINASDEEKKRINELKKQQAKLQKQISKNSKANLSASSDKKKRKVTGEKKGSAVSDKKGKSPNEGTAQKNQSARQKPVVIPIKLEALFSGLKTYTKRLHDPKGSVRDALVTISIDGPLLPDKIQHHLNPMVITIKSVKDLPSTPMPYNRLSMTCDPVHCKYSFLGHQTHVTSGRPHGRHVYFEDNHVVLLGRLNDGEVREFIQSNSLAVEIHDRDGKEDDTPGVPTIFGDEANDAKISNVGVISAKRTTHNAFQSKSKAYDPYGVARVNLIELLRGQTKLNLQIPVNPSPIPDVLRDPTNTQGNVELVGHPGAVDRPERPPFLPGHYIQSGTVLKVKISLLYPLVPHENVPRLLPLPTQMCPFARVIFYFSYENKDLLKKLEEYVTQANAKALKLSHLDKNMITATLSTYKLTIDQKKSRKLDIITGFHVIDGKAHIVVLEGLSQGAMLGLHQELDRSNIKDGEVLTHLFDTSLTFSTRLYAGLDVDLCRVRLHQSIGEIMAQPLLYVRDMVPRPCFECLSKINQISELTRLRDVVQSNLFPSSDMIVSMSREFGIPLTYDDFEAHHRYPETKTEETEEVPDVIVDPHPGRRWTPIDHNNSAFIEVMQKRVSDPVQPDYVVTNIVAVQEAGKRRRPLHPKVHSLTADVPAHNYSTQTLNTTELAKDMLRNMLREQDPKARFAYHPTYNSAMVVPVDVAAFYRTQDKIDQQRWQTDDGFVYPGVKSSRACNEHVFKPDESRINDLRLQFKDNVLHKNILEPSLLRNRMRWDERKHDIELYRRPNPYFGESPPVTIHLAGQLLEQEKLSQKELEKQRWKEGLIVDDPQMRFHRVLPQTEKTNASNQLDRLTNLLKDEPKKLSLKRQPVPVIPPLSVVLNPSVDTATRLKGIKLPPAFDEAKEKNVGFAPGPHDNTTWNMETNKIPIQDRCHDKFAKIHGHDMNLVHTERSLLSKHKLIQFLTQKEKETHYFKIPDIERKIVKKEQPSTQEVESWTEYGKGMEEKSEYRHKFPDYDIMGRIKEIYPRHTFHGLAPVSHDGKPVTRDASIQFIDGGNQKVEKTMQDGDKVKVGFILPGEASVEISTNKPMIETSG